MSETRKNAASKALSSPVNRRQQVEDDVTKYLGSLENPTLLTNKSLSDLSDDEDFDDSESKGFDKSGGWDYIPYGLRRIFHAAN